MACSGTSKELLVSVAKMRADTQSLRLHASMRQGNATSGDAFTCEKRLILQQFQSPLRFHTPMTCSRIHRLPLLLLAVLLLTVPRMFTFAVHYTAITPDNSVLLANALGQRRNFDESITKPVCFIKIHSVQDLALDDGLSYIYSVQGCVVDEFRGFGVCKSGDCDVRHYQVQIFLPTGGIIPTVQNIWQM